MCSFVAQLRQRFELDQMSRRCGRLVDQMERQIALDGTVRLLKCYVSVKTASGYLQKKVSGAIHRLWSGLSPPRQVRALWTQACYCCPVAGSASTKQRLVKCCSAQLQQTLEIQ